MTISNSSSKTVFRRTTTSLASSEYYSE